MVKTTESSQARIATGEAHDDVEEGLIVSAQAGSDDAFESLYVLYARKVYRVAFSITRNSSDAEDATQDTFLKAYLALGTFRRDSKFNTWLVRIATNTSLMVLRRRRAQRDTLLDDRSDCKSNVVAIEVVDSRPDPESILDFKQTCTTLMQSVKVLPKQLRPTAELRILQGQSISEISGTLGITNAATKARLFRARKLIKSRASSVRYQPVQITA